MSTEFFIGTKSNEVTVSNDGRPAVLLLGLEAPGQATCLLLTDNYVHDEDAWDPVQRAVWSARLRALADQIEGGV